MEVPAPQVLGVRHGTVLRAGVVVVADVPSRHGGGQGRLALECPGRHLVDGGSEGPLLPFLLGG